MDNLSKLRDQRLEARKALRIAKINYKSCPGTQIQDQLVCIEYAYYNFENNWKDLKRWFEFFCSTTGKTQVQDSLFSDIKWKNTSKETERLLHNFCAAAKTLVDITRNAHTSMDRHQHILPDVKVEIEKNFATNDLCQFVLGLRNYLLHDRPISSNHSYISVMGRATVDFHFDRDSLLKHAKVWNKTAKSFIESQDIFFRAQPILQAYYNQIHKYYSLLKKKNKTWFLDQFCEKRNLSLRIKRLEKKLRAVERKLFCSADHIEQ